jgi:hypothetical protein
MKIKRIKKSTLRNFWILSVFSVLALSAFYIYQINQEVSQRYAVNDYTKKIAKFTKENKSLEVALSGAASLAKASETIKTFGYSQTDKISYIKIMDNRVVANYLSNEKLAD